MHNRSHLIFTVFKSKLSSETVKAIVQLNVYKHKITDSFGFAILF